MGERRPPRELLDPASMAAAGGTASPPRPAPAAPSARPYTLFHDGPTVQIAGVGDCLVVALHTLTEPGVAGMGRGMSQLVQRYGGFRVLTLAERKSGSEAVDESRVAVAELVQRHTSNFRASAVVSESTGFRATALRSTVTAIHMAGRASHQTRIFYSVPPALEWLVSMRPELPLDIANVARAVETLRARLNVPPERC